jgi:hypothetical protein
MSRELGLAIGAALRKQKPVLDRAMVALDASAVARALTGEGVKVEGHDSLVAVLADLLQAIVVQIEEQRAHTAAIVEALDRNTAAAGRGKRLLTDDAGRIVGMEPT